MCLLLGPITYIIGTVIPFTSDIYKVEQYRLLMHKQPKKIFLNMIKAANK